MDSKGQNLSQDKLSFSKTTAVDLNILPDHDITTVTSNQSVRPSLSIQDLGIGKKVGLVPSPGHPIRTPKSVDPLSVRAVDSMTVLVDPGNHDQSRSVNPVHDNMAASSSSLGGAVNPVTRMSDPISGVFNEDSLDKTQALMSALNSLMLSSMNKPLAVGGNVSYPNIEMNNPHGVSSDVRRESRGSAVSCVSSDGEVRQNSSVQPKYTDNQGFASVVTESLAQSSLSGGGRTVEKHVDVRQVPVPLYLTAPNRDTGIINSTPLVYNNQSKSKPATQNNQPVSSSSAPHQNSGPHPQTDGITSPRSPTMLNKPVNKVDPILNNSSAGGHGNVADGNLKMPTPNSAAQVLYAVVDGKTSDTSSANVNWSNGFPAFSDVEKERDALMAQLEVQLKVNTDLKKLLVASVGEDLESRVEYLARDRAQLALEVGDYSKRLHKDFEDLDRLSIQADMWRSKCIASRVMIDELTGMKSQMAMKFHECQHALQEMLQERHEVRTNLQQVKRCLADLRDAFDPKHAQKFPTKDVGNVIELARASKQLADVVRFRLLGSSRPSGAALNMDADLDDNLTAAEYHASQILSDEGINQERITKEVPNLQYIERYDRFHPMTRFERLTINCCAKCNGEIKLV